MVRIKKDNLIILSILLLYTIISFNTVTTVIGVIFMLSIFVYINLSNRFLFKNLLIPKLAISLLLFQNTCIGIGAHIGNGNKLLSVLTQIPSFFLAISFCYVILSSKKEKLDLIFFGFIIFLLAYFFIGDNNIMGAKFVYFRNFIIFYFGYRIGKYYIYNDKLLQEFIKFFINLCIIASIYGFIGSILGKEFYILTGINEISDAKKNNAFVNGLPGNFITIFNNHWVNRIASFYYEPVNFSYFISLGAILTLYTRKYFKFFICFVTMILTFGKGGMLIFFLTIMCSISYFIIKKIGKRKAKLLINLSIIVVVAGMVSIIVNHFVDAFGTFNHFYGITTAIPLIKENPLGYGLGSAGNIVRQITESGGYELSETGFFNMMYQIGIIGTTIFSYLILSTTKSLLNNKVKLNRIQILALFLPSVILLVSMFQENTYTPQCIIPYMLVIGGVVGVRNEENDIHDISLKEEIYHE